MKNLRTLLIICGILLTLVVTGMLVACTGTQKHQMHNEAGTMDHSMMDRGGMDHSRMGKQGMNHDMMGQEGMNHTMDSGPADDTYDLRFIDGMIVHHQGAVEMAEEARLKSQRREILALADAIIAAQAEEMDLMNRWRSTWYPQIGEELVMYDHATGSVVPMSAAQIAAMKMSGDLGAGDDAFDLRFIEAMIPHHQGAVDMAHDALAKSQRPEIKALADEIIQTQQVEIDLMMSWKERWYGEEDHEAHH